jgi:hypothetical protein
MSPLEQLIEDFLSLADIALGDTTSGLPRRPTLDFHVDNEALEYLRMRGATMRESLHADGTPCLIRSATMSRGQVSVRAQATAVPVEVKEAS